MSKILRFFLLLFVIYSINKSNAQSTKYKLVWSDEFNRLGIIDTTLWFHQTQLPIAGSWYNGELQHYTNRVQNSVLNNGNLNIIARKENFNDQGFTKQYTSARLNSKFAFKYGKLEFRAKLPTGTGTWPAVWLLGKNIQEPGAYWDINGFGTKPWPACGEIDVLEHWGSNQNFVQSAIHSPSSYGNTVNKGGKILPNASNKFHVYSMVWDENKIEFSVDSIVHYTYNPSIKNENTWPFNEEQYLLINFAIQGDISPNFSFDTLVLDYIRVYQEDKPLGIQAHSSKDLIYPNPFNNSVNIELLEPSTQNINVSIESINGQIQRDYFLEVINNKAQINNLDDLPAGIYILKYEVNQEIVRIKLLKD